MQRDHARTLVLGIGNTLLGDEGIGVHVVNRLQRQRAPLDDVDFVDGGTLSFVLAEPIEEADSLIVIDAAQLGAAAGEVRVFEGTDMDHFVANNMHSSVHEVSLYDLLTITLLAGRLPPRRVLIGVQPGIIDWSDSLSSPVAAAVPGLCETVHGILARWQTHPLGESADGWRGPAQCRSSDIP